ncbi:PREDICTED: NAC domain-containing protein 53-like isoform X2 [Nelumbo nucifera]|uniref:NAC domain-containing protein n=2 Tax=Nelumbo nucifera TaxID=4432 RepID=A0A822YAP0_NELNU|nr:PREDICTED: NAC domain-containing protein 53-like isoform X2 [Nelumbo nucifera]DAD28601.1 TPA_asm: hypothetical protein HUJ06_030069 [Nelumbo nucifera]
MGGEAALAPGFRFHPTDEELVSYYLKRKVLGKPFRFDAISEIDVYKSEPWDLPGLSKLKTRDLQWYFFGALDKKYGNGSRTNRATDQGYWKTTGKDRPVRRNNRTVGMKKTLVYHIGRAPRGERTNWVMHEYRLVDEELERAGVQQDAYVLCRIFQKSGSGPKNGEQYGAPFIEEEWDDNENMLVPQGEIGDFALLNGGDDIYYNDNIEQDPGIGPSENVSAPLSVYTGNNFDYLEESGDVKDDHKLFIGMGRRDNMLELPDDQRFIDLPEEYQTDPTPVKDDYFVELDDLVNSVDDGYHGDDPVNEELRFFNASDSLPANDGSFIEINDLRNPSKADPSGFEMLDEYLVYFDATENDPQSSMLDQSVLSQEVKQELVEEPLRPKSMTQGSDGASSSKQPETTQFTPDVQYDEGWDSNIVKRVSRMLGSIHAPPAFAAEFPVKEAAIGQNSSAEASNPVHVTAGMIRISGMTIRSAGNYSSFGKNNVDLLLSYGMTRGDMIAAKQLIGGTAATDPMANILSGKAGSVMIHGGFYFIFFWVLILSVSFKIASYIYTR